MPGMSVATLRLAFAVVWLVVAAGLATRPWVTGPDWEVPPRSQYHDTACLLAVAFALWNLARWWQARPVRAPERRPPRPPGGEYHPEFDFTGGGQNGPSPTR